MIHIYIANIDNLNEMKYRTYLSMLPKTMQGEISKYRLKEDRYRTIAGKIILLRYLKQYTKFNLLNVKRSQYNKPYIQNSTIEFNISHSGKHTICAISDSNQIGIDIEDSSYKIDLNDFSMVLSENELNSLQNSNSKFKDFYTLWTLKEATLKAEGKGLLDEIKKVIIDKERILFKEKEYHYLSFSLQEYIVSLVYTKKDKTELSKIVL